MSDVKITDNSETFKGAASAQIERAMEACGLQAEGYAKAQLYKGHGFVTGRLRNSISHAVRGNSAIIGTNVEYAPYIEFGSRSRGGGGYHFLGKAATEHSEEYKAIIKRYLQNG